MASTKPFMWVLAALAIFAIVLTSSELTAAAGRDLLETTDVAQTGGVETEDYHRGHHGHHGHHDGHDGHGKKGQHQEVEKFAQTEDKYHHEGKGHYGHEGKHHGNEGKHHGGKRP